MYLNVLLQVTFRDASVLTILASKPFLSRVSAKMILECRGINVFFEAIGTFMWRKTWIGKFGVGPHYRTVEFTFKTW